MNKVPENKFEEAFELAKEYTNNQLALLKIRTARKTAGLISLLVLIFVGSIMLFFSMLFLGFMLAYFWAEKLNSNFYGFAIVTGLSIVILLLFIFFFKKILSVKIKDLVTQTFFANDLNTIDEDEE